MSKSEILHELCEIVFRAIAESTDKLRKAGGGISPADADYLGKLGRLVKDIKTTSAMMAAEEDGGYSGRTMSRRAYISDATHVGPGTGSYASDYSGERDGMGRFTSRDSGYSYHGDLQSLIKDMKDLMPDMGEDERREAQRFISRMERR